MAITVSFTLFAQAPNAFNYQGVARDLTGNPILNRNIGIRVSILQGTITGTEAYKELHLISTSNTGLFNILIGNGTPVSGSIGSISWGEGPFFLKIEMDENGGSNYKLIGSNQLLSVPYALHAKTADNFTAPQWTTFGNNIYYNKGNVGIGIANPSSKLQVNNGNFQLTNGDINITGGGLYLDKLIKINDYDANSHIGVLENNIGTPVIYSRYLDGTYGHLVIQGLSQTYTSSINFVTGSSVPGANPPTRRMVILGNGNIGIGKINPTSRLDVSGVVNVNNNNITNVATPVNAGDAVNKSYVDALMDRLYEQGVLKIKDADGNFYNVVKIGNQFWMAENLKTTKYNNGNTIPFLPNSTQWNPDTVGAYCYYNNDINIGKEYGYLYNWYSVVNVNKICPSGWHVPTMSEVNTLRNYLGGESVAGGKLKETGTTHWLSPNIGATNETGFTAIPNGDRNYFGSYEAFGYSAAFWSTQDLGSFGGVFVLTSETAQMITRGWGKPTGLPVRCLKD